MKREDKKNAKKIGPVVFFVLVVGAIILLVYLLTNTNETYTSSQKESEPTEYIQCVATDPSDDFFELRAMPVEAKHEIKLTLRGDNLDKVFYSFHSKYASHSGAMMTEFDITDKYNKYMAANGFERDMLSPKISSTEDSADASFYVDGSRLKPVLAPVFFLGRGEYSVANGDLKDFLLRNYQDKGFTCEQG